MIALLLVFVLQAPGDLAAFQKTLDEARAKGATPEELLKKIDAWSSDQPEEILARVAWDRAVIDASSRLDALLAEGLKKRIGQAVKIGPASGTVTQVKADRVVLGGTEVLFHSLPFDARLDDIKKQGLLPEKSADEAIFRFAAGRSVASLAAARAIPAGERQYKTLSAIAGCILQDADKGPALKVAEDFAATWTKQPDLMAAGDEALRKFIDATLAPKLLADVESTMAKDRKTAKRLVDLAAALCKADDFQIKIADARWLVLDKGEWLTIPLDSVIHDGGTTKGKALEFEDTEPEETKVTGMYITSIPITWSEVSGVRARVKPTKGDTVDMRILVGKPANAYSVAVNAKDLFAFTVAYEDKKAPKVGAGSTRKIPKKAEIELTIQWEGKKWKFFASGTEIDSMDVAGDPDTIGFVASNGKADLLSLQVRKK